MDILILVQLDLYSASLIALLVKNVPAMQETWFQSLGQEDPLAMEMANHFSIYSCLDNATDRGAWQTTVHGVKRVGQDLAIKQQKVQNPFLKINPRPAMLHTVVALADSLRFLSLFQHTFPPIPPCFGF